MLNIYVVVYLYMPREHSVLFILDTDQSESTRDGNLNECLNFLKVFGDTPKQSKQNEKLVL